MNISEKIGEPVLAGPTPPEKQLPFLKFIKMVQDSPIATFPVAAYEEPVWESNYFFGRSLLVSDPTGVKRVLLDNVANYPKAEMEMEVLAAAFGDGLLTSQGEKWRSHRRIMSPSFDFRSIVSYAPQMVETTSSYLDDFDARGDGATIDISDEMTKLTLKIVSQTMFSADSSGLEELVGKTLHDGQEQLTFGFIDLIPVIGRWHMSRRLAQVHATFGQLDEAMYGLIRARAKADGPPKDLLDRLVAARDSESGTKMTEEEVRDETVIIFLAGHETTAVAMTFVWYLLSQHPAAEAKLHAELESVLGGRAPEYADLEKLPYTRMVIEESMRLYPPAPGLSMRQAREADEIAGRKIPKGTNIIIAPWVLHRHRLLWENPDRFEPERFSEENSVGRPRFAYLPFGGGPRICIGATLAMTEASLMLATIAQRCKFRLAPDQKIELYDRITLRPRGGMKMFVDRRS